MSHILRIDEDYYNDIVYYLEDPPISKFFSLMAHALLAAICF